MTAKEVTRALGGRWHGTYGTARCPCHDDHNDSLSITDGDSTTLYKCFVGCSSADIAKNVGQKLNGHAKPNGHDDELATEPSRVWQTRTLDGTRNGKPKYIHRYRNPDGSTKFVVCRWEPAGREKIVRPAVEVPGGWEWLGPSLAAALRKPRPLYRLAEALAEPNSGILIVEGEKKADIAATLFFGWSVIGWSGGIAGAPLADWSLLPHGRKVCIWPDNDPPGIKAAQGIASVVAQAVSIVDVAALGLPDKFDLGDPLPDTLDPEAIADAAEPIAPTTPPPDSKLPGERPDDAPPWDPPGETLAPTRFKFAPLGEIVMNTSVPYLVDRIIPAGGFIVVWGPPKCGKSFWVFDLAMHVALGRAYRSRKVRTGRVVYCALEGGFWFGKRVEAFRQDRMAEDPGVNAPFFLMNQALDLLRDHKTLAREIADAVQTVDLVVIDTLNRSLNGSETEDMSDYVKAVDFLRASLNCAVVVVHHCGIDGTRPRGHTSLTASADAQIAIRKFDTGLIETKVEWMKDGEGDLAYLSRLRILELGLDVEGEPITSCVVDPADDVAPAQQDRAARMGKNLELALLILQDAMPNGLPLDDWNDRMREAGLTTRQRQHEARLRLKAKKLIHEFNDHWFVTNR